MRLDAECIKCCTYEKAVSIEKSRRRKERPTIELKGRIARYVAAGIGRIVRGIVPGTFVRLLCVGLRFAAGACLAGTPATGV